MRRRGTKGGKETIKGEGGGEDKRELSSARTKQTTRSRKLTPVYLRTVSLING